MRLGTSPDIALQGIELHELSERVALRRVVSATDGSQNGSLRPTTGARSRGAVTAESPAKRVPPGCVLAGRRARRLLPRKPARPAGPTSWHGYRKRTEWRPVTEGQPERSFPSRGPPPP